MYEANERTAEDWAEHVKMDGGGMTPTQGRVAFHQERLLYGQPKAHALYIRVCAQLNLPEHITDMDDVQCLTALMAIGQVALCFPVIGRSTDTGWYEISQRLNIEAHDNLMRLALISNALVGCSNA